jgi:general L-amino acid transport system substrate-binding protein
MRRFDFRTGILAIAFCTAASTAPAAEATLDAVKTRGHLICGVNPGLLGFAAPDQSGKWAGFDVDFCRAVAAAIFGDPERIDYVPLSADQRFDALKAGKVDILSRNSTWTMGRETELGLTFVGVTYYDGQGFMVPRSANVSSALDLGGSKVCVQSGTTTEANLADYFDANNMTYTKVTTATSEETLAAYADGRCNVITSDSSQLYALRAKLAAPGDHLILPDVISKEPLGPVVRADDAKWATLVKWVQFALIDAEELGVASDRVDAALQSKKPAVRRLVGLDGKFGEELGLGNQWAVDVVRKVGNYGEIFERNLGTGSPLGIPRGINQLWSLGGIQYAPPIE